MARITTAILLIVVLLNGATGIMAASGLSEDTGINIASGVESKINDITDSIQDSFNPSTDIVDSLILLFLALKDTFILVVEGAFAAPTLIINLGFPPWLVLPLFAPMYIIASLEVASVVTGRQTI